MPRISIMNHFWIFVVFLFIEDSTSNQSSNYRLCIPKKSRTACEDMILQMNSVNGQISCVEANDKMGCIAKVVKGEADFLPLEPEEIYIAQKFRKSAFSIIAEIRSNEFQNRDYRYEPVAVIRKSANINSISDLKGKKSCHTGFGRNAGWKIPFSHLMDKNELTKYCDEINAPAPERDLYAISKYFSKACAVGPWVPEKEANAKLKDKYSDLCKLCSNQIDCSGTDLYSNYVGALKCLVEGGGDVAWTKMDAVHEYFKTNTGSTRNIASDFALLCWDGSSQPLTSSENGCSWAKRPWRAYLASSRLSGPEISELQTQLRIYKDTASQTQTAASNLWSQQILEFNATGDSLFMYPIYLAKTKTPFMYLSEKNYSVTLEKPSCSAGKSIRICVQDYLEKLKCGDLEMAAIGRRIVPGFSCVVGESSMDCMKKISKGEADVMFSTPKQSSKAQKKYGLTPILSELEIIDTKTMEKAPFRYALAVVKVRPDLRNLTDLKGMKSCHGSIRSLAGWNAPLSLFRKINLLTGDTCGLTIELSKFFNGTCVPGARDAMKTMPWLPAESLCGLCTGDSPQGSSNPSEMDSSFCSNSPAERYYGDIGALKCLADGVGDVAFVDHVNLLNNSGGIINFNDYHLLCENGTMEISEFRHCNLGRVHSNQILARDGDENYNEREDARLSLIKASDQFSPSGKASMIMNLFGPYYTNKNLLVQDTSAGFANRVQDADLDKMIEDFDYCTTSSGPGLYSPLVHVLSFVFVVRLLGY